MALRSVLQRVGTEFKKHIREITGANLAQSIDVCSRCVLCYRPTALCFTATDRVPG
jgi:hypothetical protein